MREASDERHAAAKIMRESGARERSVRGGRRAAKASEDWQAVAEAPGARKRATEALRERGGGGGVAKRRRRARQGLRGKAKRERGGVQTRPLKF